MKKYLIILILFLFSSLSFASIVQLEVSGKTDTPMYNKSKARKVALYNAFVRAFKKIMLEDIADEKILEANKKILTKNIYSNFNAYIANYTVLEQRLSDTSFEVIVRVSVKKDKLEEDLRNLGLPYWTQSKQTNYTIIVSLLYFKEYADIESFKTLLSSIKGIEKIQEKSVIKVGSDKKMSFSCISNAPVKKMITAIQEANRELELVASEGNNVSFKTKRD